MTDDPRSYGGIVDTEEVLVTPSRDSSPARYHFRQSDAARPVCRPEETKNKRPIPRSLAERREDFDLCIHCRRVVPGVPAPSLDYRPKAQREAESE